MGKKSGKIALGIGLITGALTGLLFAPEEGKKIRRKIAKRDTKGLLDDIVSMGEEIGDIVEDFISRPSVQEALNNAKGKIADVAEVEYEELDRMMKEATEKAENFKKKVAKYVKEQKSILDKKTGKKTGKKKTVSTGKRKPSKSEKPSQAEKSTVKNRAGRKKSTAKSAKSPKSTKKKKDD